MKNLLNHFKCLPTKKENIHETIPQFRRVKRRIHINMAAPVKLFRSFERFNRFLGMHPPNQRNSFNLRSAFELLTLMLLFTSSAAQFLFKASAIVEYAQSFYISTTALCVTVNFVSISIEMRDILLLIEKYEEFIQKSRQTFALTFTLKETNSKESVLFS